MATTTTDAGPTPAFRQQIVDLARRRCDTMLPVWLIYEEDHYETVFGDGFFMYFRTATIDRDEAYEVAQQRHRAEEWYVYHVYRAQLRVELSGTLTLAPVELDATVPATYSLPHDTDWTVDAVLKALERSPASLPGEPTAERTPATSHVATPAALGRPFETPVQIIEGQVAFIEDNLEYNEREFERNFPKSLHMLPRAALGCRTWRAVLAEHVRPGVERLRSLLAEQLDPEPALLMLQHMEEAAAAYHEVVMALRRASDCKNADSETAMLCVLVGESGGNILHGWSRIRREMAEIRWLWREAVRVSAGRRAPDCRHIANATMRIRIADVCAASGFETPVICTPEELLED